MQDTSRRWRFHALQRWKKDRLRRMPSAAATKSWPPQPNSASQNVRRRNNTSYGFLWAVRCGREPILSVEDRVLFRKKFSSGKMRKSSGLPNLPRGREGLGTSELEKMHVPNPKCRSRSSRKASAFMGRPMPKNRWKTSQSKFAQETCPNPVQL